MQSQDQQGPSKDLGPMPGKSGDARDIRIGKNISAARKAVKIGQAELARRIGVESATTMWRYEHGWRAPVEKLEAIARECGVTVDALLKGAVVDDEPARDSITSTQAEILRIAQRGLAAGLDGSPEALKKFEAEILELADSVRKRR